MKKLSKIVLAGSMLVGMAGCSKSEKENVADAQTEFGCAVINVFSPGEYIGENVISDFEAMYNAKVNYDLFDSNEMMYTKLLGGSAYDVLVPSDYMIEQLMEENMLQEIDMSKITNKGLLDPFVTEAVKVYDPSEKYSIPYFWGSVGIVYDKTQVDPAVVEAQGWEIFRNTDYAGNIYFYDSQRDGFMVAFKALGYSMNTDDPDEINAAFEWLKQMNATMSPSYVTDQVIDGMINQNKAIGLMYSGDAAYALLENENLGWWEPTEGTNIWVDAMVIPSNSSCTGLAHAFIDYIISEEVQTENSTFVGYTSVDLKVAEEIAATEYEGISAYNPRKNYEKDEVFHYNAFLKQQLAELWTKVKAGAQ